MFWNKKTISLALVLALGLATEVANADFTFGTPTNLGPTVNSQAEEAEPSISFDGLELFFCGNPPGGSGNWDIWVATRATTDDDWRVPVNLGPTVNSSAHDLQATISADGLELYFASKRSDGFGTYDAWVTRRAAKGDDWPPPVNLGPPFNTSSKDFATISADRLELYITSNCPGGFGSTDLWVSTRAKIEDDWGTPVNLGPTVNSPYSEGRPKISADGLMIFFSDGTSDQRPDGFGNSDIWMTIRKTRDAEWSEPVNLGSAVNTPYIDRGASPSADGSTLYFCSNRPGGISGFLDLWQVSIDPVVDLNGDGIVDSADMCIMVDHWGTDQPLCDIGPMPWGDGVVDVEDLIVLAEHLFEDVGGADDGFIEHVIERRISAGSDDAEEALNSGYSNWNDSSDLEIVDDHIDNGGGQLVGMTFRHIDIAPGEVISKAYIEFVCDETKNGTDNAYFLIWGHLIPNSEGFIEPYVISDRPKTEAKVPWEPDPWNAVGQKIQTVNIAPIVQELINQEGWAAGNALEIIIGADPDKPPFTGVRCAESYDGSPSSAPLLHLEIAVR